MHFTPTDEQRQAREAFSRFCETRIRPLTDPRVDGVLDKATVLELLAMLAPYGIGTGWIPEEAGGAGIDFVTSGLLYEELNRVSPEIAGICMINESAALFLHHIASPAVKERYLAGLLEGRLIACTGFTEPGVGSNLRAVTTRASRNPDGSWRIKGQKAFITNGTLSDFLIVLACTGEEGELSMFMVDREEHGYAATKIQTLGLNSWGTAQIFLDDVDVPAENLLGNEGAGLSQTLKLFQHSRCFVALEAIGIAQAALDAAIDYARQREQFGKTIARHQLVQAMIADMATELDAARLLAYRGLDLVQQGVRCDAETAMAKKYATEAAVRITSNAIQIHGNVGLSSSSPVERHFRNARMLTIPEGTTQILQLVIGRALLGAGAFS